MPRAWASEIADAERHVDKDERVSLQRAAQTIGTDLELKQLVRAIKDHQVRVLGSLSRA